MENLADVDLPQKRRMMEEKPFDEVCLMRTQPNVEGLGFDLVKYLLDDLDDDDLSESVCSSQSDCSRKPETSLSARTSEEQNTDEVPSIDSIDENDNEEN